MTPLLPILNTVKADVKLNALTRSIKFFTLNAFHISVKFLNFYYRNLKALKRNIKLFTLNVFDSSVKFLNFYYRNLQARETERDFFNLKCVLNYRIYRFFFFYNSILSQNLYFCHTLQIGS